jgi:hypothetical protein
LAKESKSTYIDGQEDVKDNGKSRKLCAGLGMLYFRNATNGDWVDIKIQNIDDFHHQNLGPDMNDRMIKAPLGLKIYI